MRIFISWSGSKSKKVADYLSEWLKSLPLAIDPWVSGPAIEPGSRWNKEIDEAMQDTNFGILCITLENQHEPWICFEAGALAKIIKKARVVPYLIDIKPSELKQPLQQFQAAEATKEDTLKLVKTIHKASGDESRKETDLERAFEKWWPDLQNIIHEANKEVIDIKKDVIELPDLKKILDNVTILLESLSLRIAKWESQGLHITSPWEARLTKTLLEPGAGTWLTESKLPSNFDSLVKLATSKEHSESENYLKKVWEQLCEKKKGESKEEE